MKKIIALALALIMVLSMGVVALAETSDTPLDKYNAAMEEAEEVAATGFDLETEKAEGQLVAPGEKFNITGEDGLVKRNYKVSYDFTSSKYDFNGASLIDSIAWEKMVDEDGKTVREDGEIMYKLVLTLKENLTSTTAKEIAGAIVLAGKTDDVEDIRFVVTGEVANEVDYIEGAKKADEADPIDDAMELNHVMFAEDGAGYVEFTEGSLYGLVKVEKNEKAQVYFDTLTEEEDDAIEAYLGEDYEAIVEEIKFAGTGFKNEVAFQYDAWEEDPHFFYAWDGEKFVDLEAKYDADEDVDNYVFTADAKGIIIVTDVEIVAAADTKNPDTGANDVVGVAAALAVVSLVAAGAVSLKK